MAVAGQKLTEERRRQYRRKRENAEEARERKVERNAALWLQMERIEKYLSTLYRQREEAATRLAELTDLIRDEEQAVAEIRTSVK